MSDDPVEAGAPNPPQEVLTQEPEGFYVGQTYIAYGEDKEPLL
jgi:hypothetical protein